VGSGTNITDACQDAEDDWTNAAWTNGTYYFFLGRRIGYDYGAYGWGLYACRAKSKPLLTEIPVVDSIGFDWVAYLVPTHLEEGDSWDWGYKDAGWQQDIMTKWDEGSAAAGTTNVEANLIGGSDTCPCDESPQVSTNHTLVLVDRFNWLLKWDFQYDE